jgi:hypothetical protein
VRRYDVAIQLNKIAPELNSLPIIGNATLIAELIKAVMNAESVVTIIINLLKLFSLSNKYK